MTTLRKYWILLLSIFAIPLLASTFTIELLPKQKLGQLLFFDRDLSINKTRSCSTCHNPEFAFTDGYRKSIGATGLLTDRNSQTLINVSTQNHFTWSNPFIPNLEEQMNIPLFGTHPIEMGMDSTIAPPYQDLLKKPEYKSILDYNSNYIDSIENWKFIRSAIVSYINTLNSSNSPYDSYRSGKSNSISKQAKAGEKLFFSKKLKCASCHIPPYFGIDSNTRVINKQYANIYLQSTGDSSQHLKDRGLFDFTKQNTDTYKFKIPTLRNLKFTAPYFHDGSEDNLRTAIAHSLNQVKHSTTKPSYSKCEKHSNARINSSQKNQKQVYLLWLFLETLNDTSIVYNQNFTNPFSNEAK